LKRLNVAIVGCGWVSDWHMRDGFARLPQLFSVVAACDKAGDRASEFAERYGIARVYDDYDALLAQPDIDVVVICTPPALHAPMVIAALQAGRHVVCEKPFAASLAEVDAVARAAAGSRGRVMPIFQYRFGDGVARVRHVIQSGLAGKHFMSTVETAKRRGPDYYAVPWRGKFATELGGVLLTQAIHIHDVALWVLGAVSQVSCFKTTRVNPIEVEDCAVAILRMADGSVTSMSSTLGSARQLARLRLCFEHVTFEKTCYDEDSMRPADEPWVVIPKSEEAGKAIAEKMAEVAARATWFERQYELFYGAVLSGEPFPVTLEDARIATELITAMFASDESGLAVSLPIDESHPKYHGWTPQPRPAATGTAQVESNANQVFL
jgi:predicted dehydrogenase